ncbi:MAG: ComEC/Rec2 family competence protein [Candidatus Nanopelagicales bacterium]|nr:ComEC/Rec2 family competence protein [Candidatus Nanopelagicales bacterium]
MTISQLLAPAVAMWAGALAVGVAAGTHARSIGAALVIIAGACLAVIAGAGCAAWLRRDQGTSWVPAAVAGAAVGVLAASVHVGALAAEPLQAWVEQRRAVEITGVVTGAPRVQRSAQARVWQQQPLLQWSLATTTVSTGGRAWRIEVPIQVLGPGTPAPIGTVVAVTGRLAPGRLPIEAARLQARGPIRVLGPPGVIDEAASTMRAALRAALAGRPADAASLVTGLAIGDQGEQSPELAEALRIAGLSHLTAVSGGNVAIVVVLVIGLARLARIRLAGQVVVALVALAGFVVLVRPQPSVLRAAVMGAVVLVGLLTGGQRRGTGVLAVAIAVLMVVAPELAISWGFALSVVATLGLIVLAPHLQDHLDRALPRWPSGLREALAVTVTAQLATLPVLIAMGSTVGLAGVPANLLAMPVVPVVTVLGLAAAALGPFVPAVAALLGLVASWFASWIAKVAYAAQDLPLAVVPWPSGAAGLALGCVCAAAAVLAWRWHRSQFPAGLPRAVRLLALAIAAGAAVLALLLPGHRGWPPDGWQLVACDVDQGDGLVVRTGDRAALVVDTGLEPGPIDQCLTDLGITTIDALVVTHFHADHAGGLAGALRGREVRAAYATLIDEPPGEAAQARALLADRGLAFTTLRAGQVGSAGDARWEVLWPARVIDAGSRPNNASVVLLMHVGSLDLLLSGDVEPEAQAAIMAAHRPVDVDVAKVPHHGSRYQDPGFAAWTGARIALISVGQGNDYGHPASSTVAAWQAAGARVLRTDELGAIAVVQAPDGAATAIAQGRD